MYVGRKIAFNFEWVFHAASKETNQRRHATHNGTRLSRLQNSRLQLQLHPQNPNPNSNPNPNFNNNINSKTSLNFNSQLHSVTQT